jgi:ribose 5-phosphate isomerase B
MKIGIGADHRGFNLKEKIKEHLAKDGVDVKDFGTFSEEPSDYPDAESVGKGEIDRGILVCNSGIGMSISANKVKGVRAALCRDIEDAEASRRHNDANLLAIGAGKTDFEISTEIIDRWLKTPFEGGRHERRVKKIMALEKNPTTD